jgi:hypothetical protein
MNGLVGLFSSSSRQILQILASDRRSSLLTIAPSPPVTALYFKPRPFVKFIAGKFSGSYLTVGLYDYAATVKSLF